MHVIVNKYIFFQFSCSFPPFKMHTCNQRYFKVYLKYCNWEMRNNLSNKNRTLSQNSKCSIHCRILQYAICVRCKSYVVYPERCDRGTLCTITSKINGTPIGICLPISKLQSKLYILLAFTALGCQCDIFTMCYNQKCTGPHWPAIFSDENEIIFYIFVELIFNWDILLYIIYMVKRISNRDLLAYNLRLNWSVISTNFFISILDIDRQVNI